MEQHGEYSIQCQGRILLVDAKGPWNEELIVSYKADMLAVIRELSPNPWACIIIVHGTGLMTPEAEKEMASLVKMRKALGLTSTAMVTGDTAVKSIVRAQFERVYCGAGINYCFCDTQAQAYEWLASIGFERERVS
ncbi:MULTISPECIES: hypothetical protein [Corallincola]|uniref:STAS/SEC14 domain-containing protein n=2 Tax=Corallincola TaxID=1775176 RepID=A0A368NFV6_9GAMM|nr:MULTISPECIES: hypothetical protein [Corallincola]RCU49527.1 hypothetical protein DU002_11455 [Corallincola holothuriorum]TAA47822.1 hypothetical protein EXY25_00805 [Corallincola spongiicola]